jgi:hypothetical protein
MNQDWKHVWKLPAHPKLSSKCRARISDKSLADPDEYLKQMYSDEPWSWEKISVGISVNGKNYWSLMYSLFLIEKRASFLFSQTRIIFQTSLSVIISHTGSSFAILVTLFFDNDILVRPLYRYHSDSITLFSPAFEVQFLASIKKLIVIL